MIDRKPVFTIGHSTRTIPDFVRLLRAGEVEVVVDVRTIPRSRSNPQYNEDALPDGLKPHGIGYRRIAELGGLRGRSREVPPEINGLWKNRSFHNYADYALSDDFHSGLRKLIALADEERAAIMCAEAVWWRCHRRIISDYLLLKGREVVHLMGHDRMEAALLTKGSVPVDGHLTYPPPATD